MILNARDATHLNLSLKARQIARQSLANFGSSYLAQFTLVASILMAPFLGLAQASIELTDLDREQVMEKQLGRNLLHQDYAKMVKQLKQGDIISYNGTVFELKEYLGGDAATRIFAISDTKAIRIGRDGFSTQLSHTYLKAYKKLRWGGDSVVKVFEADSKPEFNYIVVERLTPQFDLSDFASRNDEIIYRTPKKTSYTLNPERRILARDTDPQKIIPQLEKFVRDMAKFSEIGDYNNTQVVWDGKRFVLIDWAWDTEFARTVDEQNEVLDHLKGRSSIDENLLHRLRKIIRDERTRSLPNRCATVLL